MTCIRRNLDTQNCCNAWQKGIRTINSTYPDDNREFEIRAGSGIVITPITAGILITNGSAASSFIPGTNIALTPSGTETAIDVVDGPTFADDTTINADLIVNGDIIQRGAAYETHAEHIYTADDYIIMRDGALAGLGAGDFSGFQVKLYDGVNDGRLVIDNSGTARVGDVGDEQPLLTRDESGDLTNGNLLEWDGTNQKAVDAGIDVSQIITGSGNIGDDTKPIKIVNGVATAITKDVLTVDGGSLNRNKYLNFTLDQYNIPLNIATTNNGNNGYIFNAVDSNNVRLAAMYITYSTANGAKLNVVIRNSDGTFRYTTIA